MHIQKLHLHSLSLLSQPMWLCFDHFLTIININTLALDLNCLSHTKALKDSTIWLGMYYLTDMHANLFHSPFFWTRLLLSLSQRLLIIINPLLHSILHILKLYHESMAHHSWTVHHHQHKSIRYINTNTTTEAYTCCSIWSLGLGTTQGFPAYGLELAGILLKSEGEWDLKYTCN